MTTGHRNLAGLFGALLLVACWISLASAQDESCEKCHAAKTQKPVVHAAVSMGCRTCHEKLDASTVPHRMPAKPGKGLSAEPPALCLNCHERNLFEGKVVHGP